MCDLATKFSGKLVIFSVSFNPHPFLPDQYTVLLLYHFSLIHSGFDSERKSFLMFEHVFDVTYYCTFHKHVNFDVQKRLRFSLPSIILTELLGNNTLLSQVQKVMVCDLWLVDFNPFRVFLCFKVRCLWSRAAKNVIVKAAFELLSLHVCEKRNKNLPRAFTTLGWAWDIRVQ